MWTVTSVTNLSNNHCKKSSQQTIEQNVVFLRTPEFRQVSPRRRNRFATRRIKEGERLQNACHSQRFNQNQMEGKPYAVKNGNEGQRFKFLLACHRTRNFLKSRRYFIVFSWLRPIQSHFLKAATLKQLKGTWYLYCGRCLAQKPRQRHELGSLCHQHHSQGRKDLKTGKHKVVCFPRCCFITSY